MERSNIQRTVRDLRKIDDWELQNLAMCYRLPNGGLSVVFTNFERIFYDASRAFPARYATIEVLRRKVILKDKDCILLWSYWIISSYLAQSTHCLFLQLIPWLFPTIFEIIGAAQDLIGASFASPRNWYFCQKSSIISTNTDLLSTLWTFPPCCICWTLVFILGWIIILP